MKKKVHFDNIPPPQKKSIKVVFDKFTFVLVAPCDVTSSTTDPDDNSSLHWDVVSFFLVLVSAALSCPQSPKQGRPANILSLLLSHPVMSETPWTATCQASLSLTISWSLSKFMSIASVIPSSHLVLCHPPLLLPSIFSSFRVSSNESADCIR